MKMVTAYVRTQCTPHLMRVLHEAGISGVTAYLVRGMSGESSTFLYSKRPFELSHLPESLKLEVICEDDALDRIVALIAQQARTGSPGDGIIAVQNVEQSLRIRDIACPFGNRDE